MANIQINSVPTRVQYTASGGQTVFSYTFPIKADADLKVYKRGSADSPDDSADLLALTTDYTVTGANTASGGTIVLVVAATANDIVTIVGDKTIDRTAIYDQSVTLKKADLNNDFNNTVMYEKQTETIQNQLTPKYNRSELISPSVRQNNLVLPILNDGYFWVGRGDYGDTPDDIIAMNINDLMPPGLLDATFILQTPDASLPNSQALDALANGIMVNNGGVILSRTLTGTTDQITISNGTGVSGNPVFALADNLVMPGTEGFVWVTGTTAQRPGVPVLGESRWNSDTSEWEGWDGVSWVNFISGDSSGVTLDVTQANTFTHGDFVRRDSGGTYVTAQANNAANAESVGMVLNPTAGGFTLQQIGYVADLTGASWLPIVDGDVMFLDPATAGAATATEPTTNGQISKPIFIATSTTSGWLLQYRGMVIGGSSSGGSGVFGIEVDSECNNTNSVAIGTNSTIPNLTATVTTLANTNTVLIHASVNISDGGGHLTLMRNGVAIAGALNATFNASFGDSAAVFGTTASFTYLDTPGITGACAYTLYNNATAFNMNDDGVSSITAILIDS